MTSFWEDISFGLHLKGVVEFFKHNALKNGYSRVTGKIAIVATQR